MEIIEILTIFFSFSALIVSIIAVVIAHKQYISSIKPELWSNGYSTNITERNGVSFNISNRASTATIIKTFPISRNIILYQDSVPLDIEKDKDVWIYYTQIRDSNKYKIGIIYVDRDGNKYKAILKIEKGSCHIWPVKCFWFK